MSADNSIYPVLDSFGCISQFVAIPREIASLRRERPVILVGNRIEWIPGIPDRGGDSMIDRLLAYGRKLLLRP